MKKLLIVLLGLALPFNWLHAEAGHETVFSIMDTQVGADWGLDRIDGTRDSNYTYSNSGDGVRVYVVDTGVDAEHPDFSGRVLPGFDAFNQNLDQSDCQGHGTHVAGIVAGIKYGVAKKSLIVPVRVLNCSGQGNTSTLTAGIDWILKTHPSSQPAIVNMSLGGPKDIAVNSAVSKLVNAGMVVVTAAGNSSVDACTFSPASATGVIAVGSINAEDIRSPFSNWGDCVDIFAPGSKISSGVVGNYSSVSQKSGTSQAAGFVSGAVATYLNAGLAADSIGLQSILMELSEKQVVIDAKSSTSDLLNVLKQSSYPVSKIPVVKQPVTNISTLKTISAPKNFTIKYNKLYWSRPVYSGSYSKVSYLVQQYLNEAWVTLGETKSLTYSLNPKTTSNDSLYRVLAKTSDGIGPSSPEIRNIGASSANLITPVLEPTPSSYSGISLSQRGGQGSTVVDVSWVSAGVSYKYDIEISVFGSQNWSLVRSTSGVAVKVVIKCGVVYEVRVWAVSSDGSKTLVGSSSYLGK